MAKFKPGQSGNPNGRPRGSRSSRTIIRDALKKELGKDGENEFWRALVRMAKDGDSTAISMIANRLMPTLKPTDLPIEFCSSQAKDGQSLTPAEAVQLVLDRALEGEVTPDQAKALMSAIADGMRIEEVSEQAKFLEELEEGRGK